MTSRYLETFFEISELKPRTTFYMINSQVDVRLVVDVLEMETPMRFRIVNMHCCPFRWTVGLNYALKYLTNNYKIIVLTIIVSYLCEHSLPNNIKNFSTISPLWSLCCPNWFASFKSHNRSKLGWNFDIETP